MLTNIAGALLGAPDHTTRSKDAFMFVLFLFFSPLKGVQKAKFLRIIREQFCSCLNSPSVSSNPELMTPHPKETQQSGNAEMGSIMIVSCGLMVSLWFCKEPREREREREHPEEPSHSLALFSLG